MKYFDVIRLFRQALEEAGFDAPLNIVVDGRIHRFPTNGKLNDDAGWYVVFDDGLPFGMLGCWRSGLKLQWSAMPVAAFTQTQQALRREQSKRAKIRLEQEEARYAAGRAEAARQLAASAPVQSHPYLSAKGVQTQSITASRAGLLLVPVLDNYGKLHGVQSIAADGQKRFLAGTKIRGNYYLVGKVALTVVLCEGFATALTINQCTGLAVAVAFSAGNLIAVAHALRRKYPDAQIIVAADDDWGTEGNPGRTAAKAAALAVGGTVVLPIFPAGRLPSATDFNDLQRLAGDAAVAACFDDIKER